MVTLTLSDFIHRLDSHSRHQRRLAFWAALGTRMTQELEPPFTTLLRAPQAKRTDRRADGPTDEHNP